MHKCRIRDFLLFTIITFLYIDGEEVCRVDLHVLHNY